MTPRVRVDHFLPAPPRGYLALVVQDTPGSPLAPLSRMQYTDLPYSATMRRDLGPRIVTSVLVEAGADSITVTWGLGSQVSTGDVEHFGYEVYYYDPNGNSGKRLGVRFGSTVTAWIWDNASGTQANYTSESVTSSPDALIVHYRDASLGLEEVGAIAAYAHINGKDAQTRLPVTLLR